MNLDTMSLDTMEPQDLMAFWSTYRSPCIEDARLLVGDVPHPVGTVETLAAYACAKACAIKLRLEGNIASALVYEQHCETYYEQLPQQIRW